MLPLKVEVAVVEATVKESKMVEDAKMVLVQMFLHVFVLVPKSKFKLLSGRIVRVKVYEGAA